MTTQHRSARRAPIRPSTHPASWTEHQRLLTAGVNPTTAAVLASGQSPRPDDERAYWRQLARGTPTTPPPRGAAKFGDERLNWKFEGGHGPCDDLKVSEAIDHQREARAREFIFPVRPVWRGHRVRPAVQAAGCGRVDQSAAGSGRRP
jgi:hypothetical protein